MKAIQMTVHGGPEVLELAQVAEPEARKDHSLVRIRAAGVNYKDVYQRVGLEPAVLPFIPGIEAAGVVETSARYPVGTAVAWISPEAYAQHAVVPDWKLVPLPASMDPAHGAAMLLHGLTVQYLTESTYKASAGDVALVHAGAGGVGLLLIQLLKHKGVTVVTTVSTSAKAALAEEAGADIVILYSHVNFAAAVMAATGNAGVNVVYDSVGSDTFAGSLAVLRPLGTLVLFGHSSGPVVSVDPLDLMRAGSITLVRPTLAHYVADEKSLHERAGRVLHWISERVLRLRVNHRYPLADAALAHAELESRSTTGKLILEVS